MIKPKTKAQLAQENAQLKAKNERLLSVLAEVHIGMKKIELALFASLDKGHN